MTPKVLVIIGSARKLRLSPTFASLAAAIRKQTFGENNVEIVDLKILNIHFDAEEGIPRFGVYKNEQSYGAKKLSWLMASS